MFQNLLLCCSEVLRCFLSTMVISMVVLEPCDKILWPVKREVTLTIVIIPKSVRNISRKKRLRLEVEIGVGREEGEVKPAIKYFSPCLVLVYSMICVYYVVWKLHSYRRDVGHSCVFLKSIFVSRTGVMVPRIRLAIEGSKITSYF